MKHNTKLIANVPVSEQQCLLFTRPIQMPSTKWELCLLSLTIFSAHDEVDPWSQGCPTGGPQAGWSFLALTWLPLLPFLLLQSRSPASLLPLPASTSCTQLWEQLHVAGLMLSNVHSGYCSWAPCSRGSGGFHIARGLNLVGKGPQTAGGWNRRVKGDGPVRDVAHSPQTAYHLHVCSIRAQETN